MKLRFLLAVPVLFIALSSCEGVSFQYKGYEKYTKGYLEFDEDDNFRVLQLTDAHWGVGSNLDLEEAYIRKIVGDTKPNLLSLNGDMFMHSNKAIVNRFFSVIDSLNVPFAYTYGNHDLQGLYDGEYIDSVVQKCNNSMLVNYNDDGLFGRSNYYINLHKKGEKNNISFQCIFMDSNSYYVGGEYDVFHPNQVDWYDRIVRDTMKANKAILVWSLAFFHIPGPYFALAWEEVSKSALDCDHDSNLTGNGVGCNREPVSDGYKDDGMFQKMVELGSTKGIFVGHDHVNNTQIDYKGVKLCYNLKCGQNIYHDERLLGGQYIDIKLDGSFVVTRHFQNYEGLK